MDPFLDILLYRYFLARHQKGVGDIPTIVHRMHIFWILYCEGKVSGYWCFRLECYSDLTLTPSCFRSSTSYVSRARICVTHALGFNIIAGYSSL